MSNTITLEPLIGTADGRQYEHDVLQIIVSGDDVARIRGGRPMELIGFVGKAPGLPINYLPVVHAFGDDLRQHFTLQIRQALIEYRKSQVDQARQALEQAKALDHDPADPVQAGIAAQAMDEARSRLNSLLGQCAAEESTERVDYGPSPEGIAAMLERQKAPADDPIDADFDSDADSQNL